MRAAQCAVFVGVVLAGLACRGQPKTGVEQQADANVRRSGRWSGSFQPQRSRSGGLAPTNRLGTYGSVSVIPLNGNPGRVHIRMELNTTERFASAFGWSVYLGRCGAGTALSNPVLPPAGLERVPIVNGRAQLLTEVALELEPRTTYHINLFREQASADQSAVIACANLSPN